jgi:isochorismate synthase
MKVDTQQLTLYAGAGITHDSIPEKELEETSFKIKTILDVLTK